jgi:hypothetical protein
MPPLPPPVGNTDAAELNALVDQLRKDVRQEKQDRMKAQAEVKELRRDKVMNLDLKNKEATIQDQIVQIADLKRQLAAKAAEASRNPVTPKQQPSQPTIQFQQPQNQPTVISKGKPLPTTLQTQDPQKLSTNQLTPPAKNTTLLQQPRTNPQLPTATITTKQPDGNPQLLSPDISKQPKQENPNDIKAELEKAQTTLSMVRKMCEDAAEKTHERKLFEPSGKEPIFNYIPRSANTIEIIRTARQKNIATVAELRGQVKELQPEATAAVELRKNIEDLKAEKDELMGSLEAKSREEAEILEERQKTIQLQATTIKDLKDMIESRDSTIKSLQAEAKTAFNEKVEAQEKEIENLTSIIKGNKTVIESLQDTIRKNQEKFGATQKDLTELRSQFNQRLEAANVARRIEASKAGRTEVNRLLNEKITELPTMRNPLPKAIGTIATEDCCKKLTSSPLDSSTQPISKVQSLIISPPMTVLDLEPIAPIDPSAPIKPKKPNRRPTRSKKARKVDTTGEPGQIHPTPETLPEEPEIPDHEDIQTADGAGKTTGLTHLTSEIVQAEPQISNHSNTQRIDVACQTIGPIQPTSEPVQEFPVPSHSSVQSYNWTMAFLSIGLFLSHFFQRFTWSRSGSAKHSKKLSNNLKLTLLIIFLVLSRLFLRCTLDPHLFESSGKFEFSKESIRPENTCHVSERPARIETSTMPLLCAADYSNHTEPAAFPISGFDGLTGASSIFSGVDDIGDDIDSLPGVWSQYSSWLW